MIGTLGVALALALELVAALPTGVVPTQTTRAECNFVNLPNSYGPVCECTIDACDVVVPVGNLGTGEVATYVTSEKTQDRLTRYTHRFNSRVIPSKDNLSIQVNHAQKYQKIVGFGGAFTDSVGINLNKATPEIQELILDNYFGEQGLEYNIGRIPIASCDFSERVYSYDDVEDDFGLEHWALQPEDYELKIPYIQRAMKKSTHKLNMFATPWSAPAWMKTNGQMDGGEMKEGDEYRETWKNYFMKFLRAYHEQGVDMWAVTVQNEPTSPYKYSWQSMRTSGEQEFDFVKRYLGPALEELKAQDGLDVKLMVHDCQRIHLPDRVKDGLMDPEISKYVAGVAFHWYESVEDTFNFFDNVAETHALFPDKFLLPTEACTGYLMWSRGPRIGDWPRGDVYGYDVMNDLLSGAAGWVDWNLVLDMAGGPNWAGNVVDAPIIVADSGDRFYKQPMFYYLGHYSKFITPGSVRIDLQGSFAPLQAVAFETPENRTVIVVLNRDKRQEHKFTLHDGSNTLEALIQPKSIQTFVYGTPTVF
eukprot:TRINITY_DN11474_c0_g1::TRINITY_DN11474_c0_g1_i1::g.10925::m.10925 TRINITY_DN11474_c0_g1::TRINITY_DN11474_c0_g1_i1::g.10925  ORF type:complete len:545 (-),score=176.73,sp/Q9UB00/GLCM4_CAEEL/40.61/2e-126,Glyco_hydro_30/PF02055.11/5.3e-142 TRINITY_DN11474_c0_g1_i1:44-1642(-)